MSGKRPFRTGAPVLAGAAIALATGILVPAAAGATKPTAEPLTVTREQELRFGQLTVMAPSGEIIVPPGGLPSYRNAVRVGGTTGPARFLFRGEPNQMVDVVILTPATGTFGASGTSSLDQLTMSVDFARDFEKNPGVVRLRLDPGGTNVLTIGGRLTVTPNNSSGATLIPIPFNAVYTDRSLGNGNGPGNGEEPPGKGQKPGKDKDDKRSVDYE